MNKEQAFDLTTEAGQLAELQAAFERIRRDPKSYLTWEIRFWMKRPPGYAGTPSQWVPIGFCDSRQHACILAGALSNIWPDKPIEVWSLDPLHKHLGPRQLTDYFIQGQGILNGYARDRGPVMLTNGTNYDMSGWPPPLDEW